MSLFNPKKAAAPVAPPPPTPEAPPVKTATVEDINAAVERALGGVGERLGAALGEIRQGMETLARQPIVVQPGQPVPQPLGVSDEDIDRALLTGTGGAAMIRNIVDREVSRRAEQLVRDHIDPLRTFGAESLANLSQELATGKMPYYQRFKKEIDASFSRLSPEVRANPASLKMIHDAIVGENAAALIREAAEKAVREAAEPAGDPVTPTTRGRGATPGTGAAPTASRDTSDLPSAGDVGGQEALEALKHKGKGGMTEDALAQSMGYESWAEYQKQYQDLLKAEAAGNA